MPRLTETPIPSDHNSHDAEATSNREKVKFSVRLSARIRSVATSARQTEFGVHDVASAPAANHLLAITSVSHSHGRVFDHLEGDHANNQHTPLVSYSMSLAIPRVSTGCKSLLARMRHGVDATALRHKHETLKPQNTLDD